MTLNEKHGYRVPDGYFEALEGRLAAIPDTVSSAPTRWQRWRPALALAASFAVLVSAGTALLRRTARSSSPDSWYEAMVVEDILPLTAETPYLLTDNHERQLTAEELAQYLIESGASLDQIAYSYEDSE